MTPTATKAARALLPLAVLTVVAVTVVAIVNAQLFLLTDWTMLRGGIGADWAIFVESSRRVSSGALYAVEAEYAFRYSPLLAHVFGVIAPIGPLAWRILHVVAVASLALRDRRLALIALLSWPLWFDTEAGNVIAFIVVVAVWALAGRQWAIGAFFVLTLLMPRPLMRPVAVWLLWKHPGWRLPFGAMFGVHLVLVALTGWGMVWLSALGKSTAEMESILNFGPSRLIGWVWVPIGLALATVLTWKGRLGLASIAISPYWLPYYWLMLLLDLRSPSRDTLEARPNHPRGAADHQVASPVHVPTP